MPPNGQCDGRTARNGPLGCVLDGTPAHDRGPNRRLPRPGEESPPHARGAGAAGLRAQAPLRLRIPEVRCGDRGRDPDRLHRAWLRRHRGLRERGSGAGSRPEPDPDCRRDESGRQEERPQAAPSLCVRQLRRGQRLDEREGRSGLLAAHRRSRTAFAGMAEPPPPRRAMGERRPAQEAGVARAPQPRRDLPALPQRALPPGHRLRRHRDGHGADHPREVPRRAEPRRRVRVPVYTARTPIDRGPPSRRRAHSRVVPRGARRGPGGLRRERRAVGWRPRDRDRRLGAARLPVRPGGRDG